MKHQVVNKMMLINFNNNYVIIIIIDPVDNDHVVGIPSDFKTKSQPTTAVSNFEGTVILNHTHIYF